MHVHVLGPSDRFPYAPVRTFTPRDAPKESLFALQARLGLERAVVVQSTCYGSDHSVLLDALRTAPDRLRGVALLSERMTDAELDELHAAGVRGYRLNFLPHLPGAVDAGAIDRISARAIELGWHAEVHVQGDGIIERAELIRSHPGPIVVDHVARTDLAQGIDGPQVRSLLGLLETGNVWVKLSGIDRISRTGAPWADAARLAARLATVAPDRVLWGTDYPHVNIAGDAPDDGLLVDVLGEIAGDDAALQRLLVTNPAEFFDFPTADVADATSGVPAR